jgi:hypothetical protein
MYGKLRNIEVFESEMLNDGLSKKKTLDFNIRRWK